MKNKFDYLTSLRGLAALWVMLYHLREYIGLDVILKHGYLAVDFFFILSGFVLALTYQEKIVNAGHNKIAIIGGFYVKRIARIFPLHLFVLILMLVTFLIINGIKSNDILVGRFALDAFFQQLFLVQNWGFTERLVWNVPSWSISTEIMAYIVFPFIVMSTNKWGVFVRTITVIFLLLIVATIFFLSNADNIGDKIPQLGVYRCLVEFSLGVYVYSLYQQKAMLVSSGKVVGLILLLVIGLLFVDVPNYFYVPLLLLLVFYWVINVDEKYTKCLCNPALLWLGDISYSIYLIHYFAKDLLKFSVSDLSLIGATELVVYFTVVIIASHLTYKYVEMPGKSGVLNCFFKCKSRILSN